KRWQYDLVGLQLDSQSSTRIDDLCVLKNYEDEVIVSITGRRLNFWSFTNQALLKSVDIALKDGNDFESISFRIRCQQIENSQSFQIVVAISRSNETEVC